MKEVLIGTNLKIFSSVVFQRQLTKNDFYIFGAGEARQMMKIRKFFKNEGVAKEQMHITGYWKK